MCKTSSNKTEGLRFFFFLVTKLENVTNGTINMSQLMYNFNVN